MGIERTEEGSVIEEKKKTVADKKRKSLGVFDLGERARESIARSFVDVGHIALGRRREEQEVQASSEVAAEKKFTVNVFDRRSTAYSRRTRAASRRSEADRRSTVGRASDAGLARRGYREFYLPLDVMESARACSYY